MTLTSLLFIYAAIIIVVLMCIALYQHNQLRRFIKNRNLISKFPPGTKFYYDTHSSRKCKRCLRGKIVNRKRYKIGDTDNGEGMLWTLARLHWCNNCSYRNVSLENEFKEENDAKES